MPLFLSKPKGCFIKISSLGEGGWLRGTSAVRRPGGDCLSSRLEPSRVNYGLSAPPRSRIFASSANFLADHFSSRATSPFAASLALFANFPFPPTLPAPHCEIHHFAPKQSQSLSDPTFLKPLMKITLPFHKKKQVSLFQCLS